MFNWSRSIRKASGMLRDYTCIDHRLLRLVVHLLILWCCLSGRSDVCIQRSLPREALMLTLCYLRLRLLRLSLRVGIVSRVHRVPNQRYTLLGLRSTKPEWSFMRLCSLSVSLIKVASQQSDAFATLHERLSKRG